MKIPDRVTSFQIRKKWKRLYKHKFTEPPIIIGGCGRSGTTLVLSILSAHPNIYAFPHETHTFCPGGYRHEKDLNGLDQRFYIENLYRYMIKNQPQDSCNRWCEKTPKNVHFFGRIIDFFDQAVKLIHIVRDGRSVITSKHPQHGKYYVDLERWVNDTKAGLELRSNSCVYTIRYEDILTDFDNTVRELCQFVGVSFTPEVSNWYEYATVRKNSAYVNGSLSPLSMAPLEKWKNSEHKDVIRAFQNSKDAQSIMEELKYM